MKKIKSLDIPPISFKIVNRLPRKKDSSTIYFKETNTSFKEYLWYKDKWWLLNTINKVDI